MHKIFELNFCQLDRWKMMYWCSFDLQFSYYKWGGQTSFQMAKSYLFFCDLSVFLSYFSCFADIFFFTVSRRIYSYLWTIILRIWAKSSLYVSLFNPHNMLGSWVLPPHFKMRKLRDFPGGTVVESPPAKAGDTGSSPGLGRSHMPQSN